MLSYEGIFFETAAIELIHSLEKEPLAKVNDEIHCTFKYHPSANEIFNEIIGQTFEVYLIGYASDGKNSGFEIALPEELLRYYINFDEQDSSRLKIPHITASLAEEATASDTKNLTFVPLEKPVKVTGRFGYWIKEDDKEYVSYESYPINKVK